MAGRTVGQIELHASVDGPNPAEARAHGEVAGKAMGDGLDRGFNDSLTEAFRKFSQNLHGLSDKIGDDFDKNFSTHMEGVLRGLDADWDKIDNGSTRGTKAMDRFSDAIKRNRVQVENHGQSLKHWQAITLAVTALILGAGNDIAALGSALGAGILVLGGAAAAVVAGVGVGITAITGLARNLDDLPASVRPAAKAFQDLKGVFKDLQTNLTVAAFSDSEASWRSLGATIKGLTPALEVVAKAFGGVFDSFAKGIAPGTKAFQQLDALLRGSAPIFTKFAGVVGKFASALLAAFASPRLGASVNKLLDWLDRIGSAFEDFTASKGFDHWLDNADSVFGAVGRLLDGLGRTLNNLSTDKAVQSLNGLLDAVTRFLPTAQGLIEIGGALDPLGLVAKALDAIGDAITPLIEPLKSFGEAVNRVVGIAIDEWGKTLKDAFSGLAPLISGVADALNGMDEQTIEDIADAVMALAAAFLVAKGVNGISGLATKMKGLNKEINELTGKQVAIRGVGGALAGALTTGVMAAGNDGKTDNPLLKLIGEWAAGAATGAAVGGPIGAALGLVGSMLATLIFQPSTLEQARKQSQDFMTQAVYIPLVNFYQSIQQTIIDIQTNVLLSVSNFFNSIYLSALTWFATILSGFVNWGISVLVSLGVWLNQAVANWNDFWNGLYLGALVWMAQVVSGFVSWGASIIASVLSFVGTVVANWNAFWSGLWSTVVAWTATIISNVLGFGSQVVTNIQNALNGLKSWWTGFWNGLVSGVSNAWNTIISNVRGFANTLIGIINGVLSKISALTGGIVNLKVPSIPKTATGGTFFGPQTRVIGEAGPEAVVPLNRTLSQVDPSVRGLSAYAQGKLPPASTDSGRAPVVFEAGSIVSPYADPALVAAQVADKVAEKVAV